MDKFLDATSRLAFWDSSTLRRKRSSSKGDHKTSFTGIQINIKKRFKDRYRRSKSKNKLKKNRTFQWLQRLAVVSTTPSVHGASWHSGI